MSFSNSSCDKMTRLFSVLLSYANEVECVGIQAFLNPMKKKKSFRREREKKKQHSVLIIPHTANPLKIKFHSHILKIQTSTRVGNDNRFGS